MDIFLFIFGAIIGSFLNVVALRWDEKNFNGRSECPHCHKVLRWWELVPVFSFLVLRARCSSCKHKISFQYPLVEIWTGLIFLTVPYLMLPIFCIYVVITIYDFKYKIIPDPLVYAAIILSILYAFVSYDPIDWLAGPIIFLFFAAIWFFSQGRAMGFGDAKLGLSVGLLLGMAQGLSAITLAFWIGACVSLILMALSKFGFLKSALGLTIKSEVPFAPFIILGAWISLIFDLNILHASSL